MLQIQKHGCTRQGNVIQTSPHCTSRILPGLVFGKTGCLEECYVCGRGLHVGGIHKEKRFHGGGDYDYVGVVYKVEGYVVIHFFSTARRWLVTSLCSHGVFEQ